MMQPISATTHGVIDYLWAATLPMLPRVFGWSPQATTLFTAIGATSLGYSLVTDYPLGVTRVLPMEGHLAIDLATAGALLSSPLWFDDEPQVQATLVGLGLFALVVSLGTDARSARREQGRGPGHFNQPNRTQFNQSARPVARQPYLYDRIEQQGAYQERSYAAGRGNAPAAAPSLYERIERQAGDPQ